MAGVKLDVAMLSGKRISFIGAGNIAEALVKGLVASGKVARQDLVLSARRPERAEQVAGRYGVRAATDNESCVRGASIVVIAVKPQVLAQVVSAAAGAISPEALVISVAAGVTTSALERLLKPPARVIRSMPNAAAMVGQSATAISPGSLASAADLDVARTIFEAVGRVVVVDEVHLNAVTGLSGSGPAYIFLIIEALADAGVKVGLSREVALELAAQTLLGSATMLLETGEHPGRLKDQITSPGGTAIAGLHTLEAGGLRTTLMNAVEVATRRAQELGQGSTAPERAKGDKAVES
jgi:pyrroline-5-carboxylate reductase